MAWSEAARKAALEARKRKADQKVKVTSGGKTSSVSRSAYAKALLIARQNQRSPAQARWADWRKQNGYVGVKGVNNLIRQNAQANALHVAHEMKYSKRTGKKNRL